MHFGRTRQKILEKRYGTLTADLMTFRDSLIEQGCGKVAMESSSIYWIPIWQVLTSDFSLKLANPYFIKQLPGRKSDVKDAHWIAECLQKDLIKRSFVPEGILQQMRQLSRQFRRLTKSTLTCVSLHSNNSGIVVGSPRKEDVFG